MGAASHHTAGMTNSGLSRMFSGALSRHLLRFQPAPASRCMSVDAMSQDAAPSLPKSLQQKRKVMNEKHDLDKPAAAPTTTVAIEQPLRYGLQETEAEIFHLGAAMLRQADLVNASRSEVTAVERQRIVQHFQRRKGDTGSPEVQVALLTARISSLAAHIKEHYHDKHSKRGLMALVEQRKKLTAYMKRTGANDRYLELNATLDPIGHFRPNVDTSFVRLKPK